MTVGKYLAGGMSFGAFGGRRELMAAYDPTPPGALFHAGTFNNNVALDERRDRRPDAACSPTRRWPTLNARGDRLRAELNRVAADLDVPCTSPGAAR